MIYNPQEEKDRKKARDSLNYFLDNGKSFELKERKDTRSLRQNRALHLLFTIISNQLNEMGQEFKYIGLKGMEMSMMHTPHLIKEMVWRPMQIALFNIKSTTKINTEQINKIVDVLTKYFGERGITIEFPSKEILNKMID